MSTWLHSLLGWHAPASPTSLAPEQQPPRPTSSGTFYLAPRPSAGQSSYMPPSPFITDPSLLRPVTAAERVPLPPSSSSPEPSITSSPDSILAQPKPAFLPPLPARPLGQYTPSSSASTRVLQHAGGHPSSRNTASAQRNSQRPPDLQQSHQNPRASDDVVEMSGSDAGDMGGDSGGADDGGVYDDDGDDEDDEDEDYPAPAQDNSLPPTSAPFTTLPGDPWRNAAGLSRTEIKSWRRANGFTVKGAVVKRHGILFAAEELKPLKGRTKQFLKKRRRLLKERQRKFGDVKREWPMVDEARDRSESVAASTGEEVGMGSGVASGSASAAAGAGEDNGHGGLPAARQQEQRPWTSDDVIINQAEVAAGQHPIRFAHIRKLCRWMKTLLIRQAKREMPVASASPAPLSLVTAHDILVPVRNIVLSDILGLTLRITESSDELRYILAGYLPQLAKACWAMGVDPHSEGSAWVFRTSEELLANHLVDEYGRTLDPPPPCPAPYSYPVTPLSNGPPPQGKMNASLAYFLAYHLFALSRAICDTSAMLQSYEDCRREGTVAAWRVNSTPRVLDLQARYKLAFASGRDLMPGSRIVSVAEAGRMPVINPDGILTSTEGGAIRLI